MAWWMRPGPSRAESLLGELEAVTFVADQVLVRHADVAVHDLGVVAGHPDAGFRLVHRADVAHDLDAWRVDRNDDH
jgi:hypothetical protein